VADDQPEIRDSGDTHWVPSVAIEVWIATALLHREQPEREDFTAREITERARRERLREPLRPGVSVFATMHAVANRPPSPNRLRMLTATSKGRRRLFRPGDASDPGRRGGRSLPERADLPARYRELLDWYSGVYAAGAPGGADPILALRGVGKELWRDEKADAYVRRLRAGWE
jgi:hypothetical protein